MDGIVEEDKYWMELWNEKHCALVDYRNNEMSDFCESLIIQAKEDYYSGNPNMSDVAYDRFESYLKSLRPESKVLVKVGSKVIIDKSHRENTGLEDML